MLKSGNPIKLQDANGAPGVSATRHFNLRACDRALEVLYLYCRDAAGVRTEAEIVADFDSVALFLGGEERWRLTPAQLIMVREYDGSSWGDVMDDTSGTLQIPLTPSYAMASELAAMLRVGTADLDSAVLEVVCSAACGTTEWRLSADAAGQNEPCGMIRTWRVLPRSQANTGWEEIEDLPKSNGKRLCRYYINTGATPGVVDATIAGGVEYLQNSVPKASLINGVRTCANLRAGRTELATYPTIDLMRRGLLSDAVPWSGDPTTGHPDPIKGHMLRINWSTAPAAYHIIEESFQTIAGNLPTAAAA